jgi:phage terminase large subunit-like protein
LRAGKPVFLPQQACDKKKKNQPPSVLACQMLQNPAAGAQAMFDLRDLRSYDVRPYTLNVSITCDPASSKKKGSDYTAIIVWGVDAAGNKYLLDGYHHKMRLNQRWTALSSLHRYWSKHPGVQTVKVGYERYGMQSDIEYFEERMERESYHFEIIELAWPSEGPGSKRDRMERLYPDTANGRIYLPAVVWKDGQAWWWKVVEERGQPVLEYTPYTAPSKAMVQAKQAGNANTAVRMLNRKNQDGVIYDLTVDYIEESRLVPYGPHDDVIDAASRIYDMDIRPPVVINERMLRPRAYGDS